jgi:hypothetical protein
MKARTRITAVLFLAAAGAGILPATASANPPGSADEYGHRRFTLFQHDTSQQQVNVGDPNTGVGSLYIFGGDVLDHQGGIQVGRSAGNCANTSETEILCTAAISLVEGQITFQAMANTLTFYSGLPTEFAVAGGTGAYRNARGTVTVQILPSASTDAVVTVDLR